jgi:hypothetical protein
MKQPKSNPFKRITPKKTEPDADDMKRKAPKPLPKPSPKKKG